MTVLSKRLLKPRMVTCDVVVSPAAAGGAASGVCATAGGALIALHSPCEPDQSPLERLQIFAHVDFFRHDADVVTEIGECLQVVNLLRCHVLDHDKSRATISTS